MCFLAEYRRAVYHDSNRKVENETLGPEVVLLEEEDEYTMTKKQCNVTAQY